ncbi:MAG: cysteine hydrolase [Clostridiales bacterium]|nr:cysteine hydrolase [Clostridiales bacterium]
MRLLVVVDMQNDFIDGSLGFEGASAIIPGILSKIEEYKASGDDVVYTLDTHGEDYLSTQEGKNLPVVHCIEGTEGYKLCPALEEVLSDCKAFCKPTFGSTELGSFIAAGDYDSIELCGLVSNICVISNAMLAKAFAPEAKIVVDSKLTASAFPDLHQAALDVMKGVQIEVI